MMARVTTSASAKEPPRDSISAHQETGQPRHIGIAQLRSKVGEPPAEQRLSGKRGGAVTKPGFVRYRCLNFGKAVWH